MAKVDGKKKGPKKRALSLDAQETIREMAEELCSWDDIASSIEWKSDTLQRNALAKASYALGRAGGRRRIHRAQLICGEAGNASMLIWLGKVFCGQKEQQVVEVPDDQGPMLVRIGAMPQ